MKIEFEEVWTGVAWLFWEIEKVQKETVYINLSDVIVIVTENKRPGKDYCHRVILVNPNGGRLIMYVTDPELLKILAEKIS